MRNIQANAQRDETEKEHLLSDGADQHLRPCDAQTLSELVADAITTQLREEETRTLSRRAQEQLDAENRSREMAIAINEQLGRV